MGAPKGNKFAKGNKGGGNLTLFKPEYIESAYNYALLGVTDTQLGKFYKVTEQTIITWKKKHKEFALALKRGKEDADAQVTKSLFKRATGYETEETKVFLYKGKPIKVTIDKHIPPETIACIYWLNNRQPDKWRNKTDHEPDKTLSIRIVEDGDSDKAA